MWNVEGGLATLVRGKGTVLTASMGTGSQGAYVGASVPIMLGAEESQEGSSYLSPYARVYAWEAKPDVVVGLTWKRILTMPGLSRLF
jgi:hypothetical protein